MAMVGKHIRAQGRSLSPSQESFEAFVLDCGSGRTRVYHFESSQGIVMMKKGREEIRTPLAQSLGDDNGRAIASSIASVITDKFGSRTRQRSVVAVDSTTRISVVRKCFDARTRSVDTLRSEMGLQLVRFCCCSFL